MKCRICSASSESFATAKILTRYDIEYFQCPVCGFVQTEEPFWLNEAYAEAINRSDVGMVSRNIMLAKISQVVISLFFDRDARYIDYGGGYGLFVRLLRDAGFDFYYYDKHCSNLFAKTFEADDSGKGPFELLTAFEVFEHLINPHEEIEKMLDYSKNILFNTLLVPRNTPHPDAWWYYGLDHGQHISFFTLQSLTEVAKKHRLNLYSNGTWLHLLTPKCISSALFHAVSRYKIARMCSIMLPRKSLLQHDYKQITGKDLS